MSSNMSELISNLNKHHSLSERMKWSEGRIEAKKERRPAKEELPVVEEKRKEVLYEPAMEDTLFWCIYYMLSDEHQMEHASKSPFATRASKLIEWTTLIREHKTELKAMKIKCSEVEMALSERYMSPIVCAALATVVGKPIILISGNTYFKTGVSSDAEEYQVICKDKHGDHWVIKESLPLSSATLVTRHKLECIPGAKTLKAVGSYSKSDLEELCIKLGLPRMGANNKALNKSEMYRAINDFVSL